MAVIAIPNPKKSIQIDFPIEKVKQSVKNLSLINKKYKLNSTNEILNQYTFESYEFLSLGVYIDIHLNSINDNKTEINVEIRRKVGSFNQSHEVTNANEHMVKIFNAISKLLEKSSEEIEEMSKGNIPVTSINSTSTPWYEKTWLVVLLVILFWPLGLVGLWKSSKIGQGVKIAVTLFLALALYFTFFKK